MAAFKCDICGGNLIIEKGGKTAICESCGTKHNEDRVKEKIQEIKGTVKIEGAVETVDGVAKLSKLVKNAETLFSLDRLNELEEVSDKLIADYPEDYHGWLYKWIVKMRTLSKTISIKEYYEMKNRFLETALKLVDDNQGSISMLEETYAKAHDTLLSQYIWEDFENYSKKEGLISELLRTKDIETLDDFLKNERESCCKYFDIYVKKVIDNIANSETRFKLPEDWICPKKDKSNIFRMGYYFPEEHKAFVENGIAKGKELRNCKCLEILNPYTDVYLPSFVNDYYIAFASGKTIISYKYAIEYDVTSNSYLPTSELAGVVLDYHTINYNLDKPTLAESIEEIKEKIKAGYRKENKCQYCGGAEFNLLRKCKKCGKRKDY